MPLIVICGLPCSGKTAACDRICKLIHDYKSADSASPVDIKIVKDSNFEGFSYDIYRNSAKEKEHRGFLRSEVQKYLRNNVVVIVDSLNYIKGFRYELYCIAKTVKTTYCVVFCEISREKARENNRLRQSRDQYPEDILNDLIGRFEEPNFQNRWDSPLVTSHFLFDLEDLESCDKDESRDDKNDHQGQILTNRRLSQELHDTDESRDKNDQDTRPTNQRLRKELGDKDESRDKDDEQGQISTNQRLRQDFLAHLFEGKHLKANQSTQSQPSSGTNFLYELDIRCQKIIDKLMADQKLAVLGDQLTVEPNLHKFQLNKFWTLADFTRSKRQFLAYVKQNPPKDLNSVPNLFINFLNNSLV